MAQLRTDYKDEILDASVNTQRKYRQVDNGDGTISFVDVTEYSQQGDPFGAGDINAITGNLTADNGESFNFVYNSETNEYGYMAKVEGADTFCPFKSGATIGSVGISKIGSSSEITFTATQKGKYTFLSTFYHSNAGVSTRVTVKKNGTTVKTINATDGFYQNSNFDLDLEENDVITVTKTTVNLAISMYYVLT